MSLVFNIFANGFSIDDQVYMHQFSRNTKSITDAINLASISFMLDSIFTKTEMKTDGNLKPNINYYEGGVIIEIRDFREGRAKFDENNQILLPYTFRTFLKPDYQTFNQNLDTQNLSLKIRLTIEQSLIKFLHPYLHLDPFESFQYFNTLIYNNQKFNTAFLKTKYKKKYLIARREFYSISNPFKSQNQQFFFDKNIYESQDFRLISHLETLNYRPYAQDNLDNTSNFHYKKSINDVPSNPTLIEDIGNYPSIVGSFVFNFSHSPDNSKLPHTVLEINNKNSSKLPLEMHHFSLKFGQKPLHFEYGGPSASLKFLNQFKHLETPASPLDVKSFNDKSIITDQIITIDSDLKDPNQSQDSLKKNTDNLNDEKFISNPSQKKLLPNPIPNTTHFISSNTKYSDKNPNRPSTQNLIYKNKFQK